MIAIALMGQGRTGRRTEMVFNLDKKVVTGVLQVIVKINRKICVFHLQISCVNDEARWQVLR